MAIRRFGTSGAFAAAVVLALSISVAGAAAPTNVVLNGGFETPKVPTNLYATFPVGSTLGTCGLAMPGSPGYQAGCWRVFAGSVDVVQNGYWVAKSGKQSIELNGTAPGSILQAFPALPSHTYRLRFSLAGSPLLAGTVTMLAVTEQFDASGTYITGSPVGSYSFNTSGHSTSSMGYQPELGFFTTGSTTKYVDVEFQSTTQLSGAPWWGPVVDAVNVTDRGPTRGLVNR